MNETPLRGLTAAEVAERQARGEVNRVRRSAAAEYAGILRRNIFTLFNALVAPAALALFLLGGSENLKDAAAISGLIVLNTLLALVQEIRAKRHFDRLTILAESRARVRRDGKVHDVAAGDVVRGDCVLVAAGEPVVADGPVLESRYLEVDEALLTGESDPQPRRAGAEVLSGSFCVAGEGAYRADRVGAESFAQRTSAEARAYHHSPSPLQISIDRIVQALTYSAVALVLLYVVLQVVRDSPAGFAATFPQQDLMKKIAATITSMVPQGLVLMATLAFTLGAVRLSRRGALVQRLNAVEAMASVDMLCMDKTGTLTTNNLRVARLHVLAADLPEEAVRQRLRLFASASPDGGNKSLAALRVLLGASDVEPLDQIPFKSQNRYSAVRVRGAGGEHVLVLGAGEALRPFLDGATWEAAWQELTRTGLRLLLFAEARGGPDRFSGSLRGYTLRALALVALSDELRPEAAAVLRALAGQGIGFKILSGDNPETVRATVAPLAESAALRALVERPVVTGSELEAAADPSALVAERSVFGRVAPRQKVQIVAALKAQGRRVAMLGDGVNDVLPIKNAQLGIAMGDGSRASKTVASLVLETNNFELLPETLDEGRLIVRNLRRAARLFLTKTVFAPLLILGTLGDHRLAFPFLPRQVTLLNVLTIGVPALLILMSRTRAPAVRTGFLREVGGFALRSGVILGAAGLVLVLLSAFALGDDVPTQRTLLLATLVLLGGGTLLRALEVGDDRLRWLAPGAIAVFLAVMYTPLTRDFFDLTPLSAAQWMLVLAVAIPAFEACLLADRWFAPGPRTSDAA